MPDPTTNFEWNLPDVAGDSGAWGTLLNTIFNDIDDELNTAKTTANAALPKAGGVMTGHLDMLSGHITGAHVVGGSGTKTIDLDAANFYEVTTPLSGAVVFDITNIGNYSMDSTDFAAVIIKMKNAGAASSITYKIDGVVESIKWQDGSAPTYTTTGDDIFVFFTYDAGGNWIGVHAVADPS